MGRNTDTGGSLGRWLAVAALAILIGAGAWLAWGPHPAPVAPPLPRPAPDRQEMALWQTASAANDALQLEGYLRRYPKGVHAAMARERIVRLRQAAATKPLPPPRQRTWRTMEDICGDAPRQPSVPAPSSVRGLSIDAAHSFVLDSFHRVKAYQIRLATYRDCFVAQASQDQAALVKAREQHDTGRAAHLEERLRNIQAAYDKGVDVETLVVTEYSGLHDAYCRMADHPAGCPPPRPDQ